MIDSIINKSEKILKTDVRYLLKGGIWLGVSQFFVSISSLILSIAFANLLPKETYGVYKFILSVSAIIAIPTLSGIDVAVTQAVARKFEGSLKSGFVEKMRWGILASVAGFSVAVYYYINGNMLISYAFVAVALFIPFMNGYDIYNSLISGRKLFGLYTLFSALTQIITVGSLVVALFFTDNLLILILVFFASNTLANYLFFVVSMRTLKPNNEEDPSTIGFGKHLSLADVINTIAAQIDKVLLFHYFGPTDLAIYTFAIAPTEQIKGLLKNIHSLAMPKFAVRSKEEINTSLGRKMAFFGLFILSIMIIYVFAGDDCFDGIIKYHGSKDYVLSVDINKRRSELAPPNLPYVRNLTKNS